MIFTLFDLFKFVRVFYWRILLSHFCVFFGFITMWRYWNSFPLERETVCSCRFHLKLIRVKFKQTLGRYFFTNSIRSIFTAFAIFKVMTCLPCVSFTSSKNQKNFMSVHIFAILRFRHEILLIFGYHYQKIKKNVRF